MAEEDWNELSHPPLGPEDVAIQERETLFDGFFRLSRYTLRHRLYAGGWSDVMRRERFERGNAVVLLPYDPDRDRVVLVEQFRIGALERPEGPWLLEFVAGMVEEGEQAEEVARREAEEEAGLIPGRLEHVMDYYVSPGGNSEGIRIYCGETVSDGIGGIHGLDDENEDIRVFSVPFDEAWALLEAGRIDSAAPIIALQWLAMNRERLQREWSSSHS